MPEYIDREAFERALVEVYRGLGGYKTRDAFYKAIDIAHSFPKSEVCPVRHGRLSNQYIDEYYGEFANCMECGTDNILPCNYCRNCGAKMDGGKNDA